ncbi:GNAT family N-acetyltransferase [Sphingomonas sp. 1P06PA]|uniref:GNAT family N-acetyltransferase n=1 Tax=Sphingomonas sp. 1P06PA TaxID=554121 RepID=UPI0039A407C0
MIGALPPGLAVSPADARDLGDVMRLMGEAFDPAWGEAWTRGQCLGILGLPGVWLSIVRNAACGPAGFALSRIVLDEAELLLLGVAPRSRGQGIGGALLAETLRIAAARGAERLHLEVRDGNGAIRLYESAGFIEVGRRRGYYRGADGKSFDAITLSRTLI